LRTSVADVICDGRIIHFIFLLIFQLAGALINSEQLSQSLVVYERELDRGDVLKVLIFPQQPLQEVTARVLDGSGEVVVKGKGFTLGEIEGNSTWCLLLGLPNYLEEQEYRLEISGRNGQAAGLPGEGFSYNGSIVVRYKAFISEKIFLDRELTDLRSRIDPRKQEESEYLWDILTTFNRDAIFHEESFNLPLGEARRSGNYGDRRTFQYSDGSSALSCHQGIDFAVPQGTPVAACGSGKVVLARYRIITGDSVVLEHLPGLYSIYYHLSSLSVDEGDYVESGEILGNVGNSGLSTGPHLHWEVRVSGVAVNPESFTCESIIDKSNIISIIRETIEIEGR
jgi:murein DD-endopeptidase MepM/ murein hydrolase activator NlpD